MVFFRLLYFSALCGALAGLLAWGTNALISATVEAASAAWVADAIVASLFAILLAPFLFVQLDRFSGKSFRWSAVGIGILIALASAAATILMLWFLRGNVAVESPLLYRL